MFTVNDFADLVIAHEYGPMAKPATVHGSPTAFGYEEHPLPFGFEQRYIPFIHAGPSYPVTFGHTGWDERHPRQQHHVGHGFYPEGFREGHFIPPGYCMAPWECDADSSMGADSSSDDLRHPDYVPFSAGADYTCAKGDPMCDIVTHGFEDDSRASRRSMRV